MRFGISSSEVSSGWGEGLESVLVVGVFTWYVLEELWVFVPGGWGGWAALCSWVGSDGRGLLIWLHVAESGRCSVRV